MIVQPTRLVLEVRVQIRISPVLPTPIAEPTLTAVLHSARETAFTKTISPTPVIMQELQLHTAQTIQQDNCKMHVHLAKHAKTELA